MLVGLAALLAIAPRVTAAMITVNMDSGHSGSPAVFDQNVLLQNALSGGTNQDGNGCVLQLGYYSQATTANNFLGNWVPLTGEGSANNGGIVPGSSPAKTYDKTSVGDVTVNGAANGTFASSGLTFVSGSATGRSLPASTTIPLAIRLYNASTIASSTFYNVVSDDLWLWKDINSDPPPLPINISLNDPGLEWLSIASGQAANTAFHTTMLTVPEPGISGLLLAGLVGIVARRRRVGKGGR
ncbi:MAG: hypothetical protein QOE70_2413 [Chthoniobacter sp.]|jgi:hypothetical protein|nr:hypothetical protein [Chthoniobacter sp.]